MEKHLTIANKCSIALNYLVFIHNVISNQKPENDPSKWRFPAITVPLSGFDLPRFETVFYQIWTDIIALNQKSAIVDLSYVNDRLSKEFTMDSFNTVLSEINELFESWWNHPYIGGYTQLDYMENEFLSELFLNIKEHLDQTGSDYDINLIIDVIYDNPKTTQVRYSNNYVVVAKSEMPDFRFFQSRSNIDNMLMNRLKETILRAIGSN